MHGVPREHPCKVWLDRLILKLLGEGFKTEVFCEVLEQNLDEDTGAGRGVLLGQSDGRQTRPRNGIGVQQMPEELRSISHFVNLDLVHVVVGLAKELEEFGRVEVWVEQTEALSREAIESHEGALLGATLQDHVAKFHLLTLTDVELKEFVAAFLILNR